MNWMYARPKIKEFVMSLTFAIIKPDAVRNGHIGEILKIIERNELKVVEMRMLTLPLIDWQRFYAEHKDKHFFKDLTTFMASGPCVVLVLQHAMAQTLWRSLMPAIRSRSGNPGVPWENAVHGSDSNESAQREMSFFERLLHASSE
jgi:nucleoside-diphosphate kinase